MRLSDEIVYGICAAVLVVLIIFIYLIMGSYTEYVEIESFYADSFVDIPEDDIELKPENIQVYDQAVNVQNATRDRNDDRQRADDYNPQQMTPDQIEQKLRAEEAQMLEEAGGEAERQKIREQMTARIEREKNAADAAQKNNNSDSNPDANPVKGNVMVEWELDSRSPHQGNDWYVRNPGYTCGRGSAGKVVIDIRVDNGGNVISAAYNPLMSSEANACMVDQGLKYAKMSRFNYSGSAPKAQSGRIIYIFVSQ